MLKIVHFLLFFIVIQWANANPRFAKYPYGLLGEDYGLLTEQDLAVNAWDAYPEPFSPSSTVYPYWQCFKVHEISILCENSSYSENQKAEAVIMAVRAENATSVQEYLSPRPISVNTCHRYQKDWQRLSHAERFACVSGQLNEQGSDNSGTKVTYWIFDKLKTKRGCVSYFRGACSQTNQSKRRCTSKSAIRGPYRPPK